MTAYSFYSLDYDAEEQTADNAWHAEKSEEEEGELTGLQEGFEEGMPSIIIFPGSL